MANLGIQSAGGTGNKVTKYTIVTKTADYSVSPNEFVLCDLSSNSIILTLPTAPLNGTRISAKLLTLSGTRTVTLVVGGSDKFNSAAGPSSLILSLSDQTVELIYNSTTAAWVVAQDNASPTQLNNKFLLASACLLAR